MNYNIYKRAARVGTREPRVVLLVFSWCASGVLVVVLLVCSWWCFWCARGGARGGASGVLVVVLVVVLLVFSWCARGGNKQKTGCDFAARQRLKHF